MPDGPKNALDRRYAAARVDMASADARMRVASGATLAKLLRLSVDRRFAALEQASADLTPEDRRTLLRSLRDNAPAQRTVSAKSASWWAIWRSRARYRTGFLSMIGVFISGAVGLAFVVGSRTPEQMVFAKAPYNLTAMWAFPNGTMFSEPLDATIPYALYRREGDKGILLKWVPGVGYAYVAVPLAWLWPQP